MTAAVITACASVVVAVLVFVLNQWAQRRRDQRQARLDRLDLQLRELYGPLYALVLVNESIWRVLGESVLPDHDARRVGAANPAQREEWAGWLRVALMPTNIRIRDLIVGHAELLEEVGLPAPLEAFCAHVAASEMAIQSDPGGGRRAIISHPGAPFVDYVRATYLRLKQTQAALLPSPASGRAGQR